MTVPAAERKAGPFNGNGSTTEFPFSFKIFTTEDVEVVFADVDGVETVLELDSDYSVSMNADQDEDPGGTVTYPISGSALATGEKLSIAGALPYEQETDIPTGGNFNPTVLENALDKLSMQTQQLAEAVSRAAKVPITNAADADTLTQAILVTANNIAGLEVVVANINDIQTVADDLNEGTSEIEVVAGAITNVNAVGNNISNVNTVAGISSNVTSVAGNATNINTVAANNTNVSTVAGISANVTTVAGISANVTSVAGNATNINAVASNATNINAVNANKTNIDAVAGNATNINAVNSNKTNIDTAATNIAAIIDAPNQATAAANSASLAAASAASGMYSAVQDKSADYTVAAGDAGDLIRVTTTGGARTITLPQISTVSDGFKVAIVKWTGDSNAVTVARSGSDTINGATSANIGAQYTQVTFVADFETNQWFAATSGLGSTNVAVDVFSGNGSTTAFTLAGDAGSKNNTLVTIGGVYQAKSTYSLSGTTLTFSTAPPSGTNNIEVVWSAPLAIGTPSDGTVTRAKLSVTGTPDGTKFLRDDMTWQVVAGFDAGTAMLFVQTAAPTGWTKSTTHDNKALRVVSGTAGSGGSVAFTTAFASGLSAGATTLAESQIPSHTHSAVQRGSSTYYLTSGCYGATPASLTTSGATGGGGSHTHTLPSFAVSYVDTIIATKN
jgi:hypothetical protein